MNSIVVVLGSGTPQEPRYAIFTTDREDLVVQEDIDFLDEALQRATIVFGPLHKALLLADYEAEAAVDGSDRDLPGILVHHLATCRISPDTLEIEIN